MSTTIQQVEGGWKWEVQGAAVDYMGHSETREEAVCAAAAAEEYEGPGSSEQTASLEAEVAQEAAAARRATLLEAIDLIEQRAVQRGRQVDVAQNEGGAWEVVAGKSSELQAVADLLRRRLPALTPPA
jgi:vacuolar-type H+-ATPase subunit B/Vma2